MGWCQLNGELGIVGLIDARKVGSRAKLAAAQDQASLYLQVTTMTVWAPRTY
jgi:hypothetical protein